MLSYCLDDSEALFEVGKFRIHVIFTKLYEPNKMRPENYRYSMKHK